MIASLLSGLAIKLGIFGAGLGVAMIFPKIRDLIKNSWGSLLSGNISKLIHINFTDAYVASRARLIIAIFIDVANYACPKALAEDKKKWILEKAKKIISSEKGFKMFSDYVPVVIEDVISKSKVNFEEANPKEVDDKIAEFCKWYDDYLGIKPSKENPSEEK